MLRKRKNRRYNEETNDEDGERKFNLAEQIKSLRFEHKEKHLLELSGEAITLRLIQRNGFEKPILVTKPDGLDLRVPPKSFLVRDVRNSVGHERIIDVMDVKTQKNIEMSMKDWCKYYESKNRDRLLNVISLEFSHTKLDDLVDSPMIVKLLDWVDLVWPKFLKQSQTESTNTIDKMKYPKVQKYCLMSVKGSYTDFHIDFGGTSVWYHILRGKKIFWMVPPTELNLSTFEEWTLSGMQQNVFFGDTVEECFRVELCAGNTFFIPSGWIHAVYTLEDSLVFGGNFLHSFGIENQLKVSRIEDATRVPVKFRYPFYTEILWYVVQHYVYCLTEKDHLHRPTTETAAIESPNSLASKTLAGAGGANNQNKDSNSIEIEDESTESEYEESDSKQTKKKSLAASKRKKGGRAATKAGSSAKKSKKPVSPPTDDESTDIDSANEELAKPVKKPANTCRMTKNSLLRLQYEVEEKQQETLPPQSSSSSSSGKSPNKQEKGGSQTKSTPPKKAAGPAVPSKPQQQTGNKLDFADLHQAIQSHNESNLNGWAAAASGGQSSWSNPNADSNEPKKIHITKYELAGLKVLVKHLSKLSGAKKNLPNLIRNSRALLDDCRKLIVEHENDDPELAITGKPITPELIHAKKPDLNELIGQFFKPDETTTSKNDESSSSIASLASPSQKFKLETPLSHQRLKFGHSSTLSEGRQDEKKIVGSTSSGSNDDNSSPSKTAHNKETKCLSPNKKLSTKSATTTASPPPRPKSPPTRPLSNNQYTSKTKNNNNLLLPGSFADLIAATSTEKKVFDVSGADVTSSLFGIKDLGSTKSASSSRQPAKPTKEKGDKPSSSSSKVISPIKSTPHTTESSAATTSTGAGAGHAKEPPKPNSPEPPKAAVQKRFITPNLKPQNKEKLIYASAPYISPVHVSDQARSNNPYPWQTPAQHPPPHPPPAATYSPATPGPRPTHSSATQPSTSAPTPPTPPSAPRHQAPPYTTPDHRTLNPRHVTPVHNRPTGQHEQQARQSQPQQQHPPQLQQHQKPAATTQSAVVGRPQVVADSHSNQPQQQVSNKNHTQVNVIVKPYQQQQQPAGNVGPANRGGNSAPALAAVISPLVDKTKIGSSSETPKAVESAETKVKKPTKPRGPPKKSKEARQAAIETSDSPVMNAPIPVSVIAVAPSTSSSGINLTPSVPKPKVKRPKKQNELAASSLESPATNTTSTTATPLPISLAQSSTTPHPVRLGQPQPSVVCGVVAPPSSTTGGPKINPQSYLISRPLLFNNFPTFSAAQYQQLSRTMPIFTTPMGSPLGLPQLQQGARIVWATSPNGRFPAPSLTGQQQPTNAAPPSTTVSSNSALNTKATPSSSSTTTTAAQPPRVSGASQLSDNAALLSLATTALSTAPMASSPALSQMSNRAPPPQAIMVSSAPGQPAVYAGQQFFRHFLPRLPMTHLVTSPGAPRPAAGQLVFARLPNQSQQRYLIAQPGFMPQRFQAATPHIVTSQPASTLAFAAFKPPASQTKVMKTKKVKTS